MTRVEDVEKLLPGYILPKSMMMIMPMVNFQFRYYILLYVVCTNNIYPKVIEYLKSIWSSIKRKSTLLCIFWNNAIFKIFSKAIQLGEQQALMIIHQTCLMIKNKIICELCVCYLELLLFNRMNFSMHTMELQGRNEIIHRGSLGKTNQFSQLLICLGSCRN